MHEFEIDGGKCLAKITMYLTWLFAIKLNESTMKKEKSPLCSSGDL